MQSLSRPHRSPAIPVCRICTDLAEVTSRQLRVQWRGLDDLHGHSLNNSKTRLLSKVSSPKFPRQHVHRQESFTDCQVSRESRKPGIITNSKKQWEDVFQNVHLIRRRSLLECHR